MDRSKLSVLIVDDVAASRRVMKRLLEKSGVTAIKEAANGESALQLLNSPEEQFHLVITDLNLGGATGVDLINSYRQNAELKDIPAIIVTSDADRESVMSALELGVSCFLLKPFDSTTLLEKIDEALAPLARQ